LICCDEDGQRRSSWEDFSIFEETDVLDVELDSCVSCSYVASMKGSCSWFRIFSYMKEVVETGQS
jgi:hypothetical protein